MNKLITGFAVTGIALAAAMATPALADSASGYHRTGAAMTYGHDAYAYAPESGTSGYAQAPGTWVSPYSVIQNGEYRGADPDPAIRLDLMRDVPQSES